MIGNIANVVMNFLADMLRSLFSFLFSAIERLFNLIYDLTKFIADLFQGFIQAIINVLLGFFNVIYDLIRCVLYLIYKIGVLAVKLFQVLWEIAKLLYSFVVGLTKTVASLFYTPKNTGGHGYSETIGQVVSHLGLLQMNVVAYILLFLIWIFVAITVIKILGTFKNA